MFRPQFLFVLFACITFSALTPRPASAQDELASCKTSSGDAGGDIQRLEDNSRFYGTV